MLTFKGCITINHTFLNETKFIYQLSFYVRWEAFLTATLTIVKRHTSPTRHVAHRKMHILRGQNRTWSNNYSHSYGRTMGACWWHQMSLAHIECHVTITIFIPLWGSLNLLYQHLVCSQKPRRMNSRVEVFLCWHTGIIVDTRHIFQCYNMTIFHIVVVYHSTD